MATAGVTATSTGRSPTLVGAIDRDDLPWVLIFLPPGCTGRVTGCFSAYLQLARQPAIFIAILEWAFGIPEPGILEPVVVDGLSITLGQTTLACQCLEPLKNIGCCIRGTAPVLQAAPRRRRRAWIGFSPGGGVTNECLVDWSALSPLCGKKCE